MDSGAAESVINRQDLPNADSQETEASRTREDFASATNEPIPNLGELKLRMYTREGTAGNKPLRLGEAYMPARSYSSI